jgi:cell filamentation protein, protein adenylyltransferase
MDKHKFSEKTTGSLVQITEPKRDWAFVPNPLPAAWSFDPALWPLLVEAKETLGTLNGIGQTLKDPNLLLRPLQNREAIASSNIEGTFVTPEQLLLYGLDPKDTHAPKGRVAEWREVFNYDQALQRGCEALKTLPVCNRVIKDMHAVLMTGICRGLNKPGMFRQWQVHIGSNGRFVPPPAEHAIKLMDDLENYVNTYDPGVDQLVRAFIVHYQFEAIHPFGDGNGRVGRALLALMIYNWLDHSRPWLYLSAFFEAHKDEYIQRLFNVSARGEWLEWIEFCLRGTVMQANDSIRRCREFNRLHDEFQNRVTQPSCRTHRLIDKLFISPVVSVTSTAKEFDVDYQTARKDLEKLVEFKILRELRDHRPRSFVASEVMSVAYDEPVEWEVPKTPSLFSTEPSRPYGQSPVYVPPTTWQIAPSHPLIPQGDPVQQRLGSSPSPPTF